MATEQFTNDASSTLDGGIDNIVTSLDVISASLFPTAPQFRIKVESEILLVTAVASNTFTVERGIEGTSPASHANGVQVTHILTAGAMSRFKTDTTFIAPPALSGDVDDYSPTGLATAKYIRLDGGAADRNITGLNAPEDSQEVTFINIGSTNALVFKHEDANSLAANRFRIAGGDVSVTPDETLTFVYDPTTARWRAT